MSLTGLILAAGKGKRMQSDLPKVLHQVAGKPMLEWVIQALTAVPCESVCVVLSQDYDSFLPILERYPKMAVCLQAEINGTAGAVAVAQNLFEGLAPVPFGRGELLKGLKQKPGSLLICLSDTPALDAGLLANFVAKCQARSTKLGVLAMKMPNPTGYGRLILSPEGRLKSIVEEKDADEATRKILICNSGILFAEAEYLFKLLQKIDKKNSQNEYYLTDCIRIATHNGEHPEVIITEDWKSLMGINDREQLASLDSMLKKRLFSKE